ncbi:uncharacterized protein METZ01_LOCUS49281 [marine metagenome]|uniref:Uncharacterized protein n=1 Tax=marine metagenome TaxID=408172 RepID=A0A381S2H9_9ZZZZ
MRSLWLNELFQLDKSSDIIDNCGQKDS